MNITPISAFSDNYIWAIANDTDVWLVDPGQYAPVANYLREKNLRLRGILITHHHYDHQGAVAEFLSACSVPVVGPRAESIPLITHPVKQNDLIDLAPFGLYMKVLEVPGHTLEHIAFFGNISNTPRLFCGDTLFAGGCGRVFEGTAQQMWASLQRLAALPAETLIYCAHEYTVANLTFACAVDPDNDVLRQRLAGAYSKRMEGKPTLPSSLEIEKETNPFLRTSEPALIASATKFLQQPVADGVQCFAVLRKWKDGFVN